MKHLTCRGKYQLHQLTSLKVLTKTWYLTFDKMADECCALTAKYRLIYKFIEPNQNLGQKVQVRFGFVRLMGSVRFEFYSLSWYTLITLVYTTPDYGITYS